MKNVMVDLLVILLVMYIGLLASMILPYKRKKAEAKIEKFDLKFLIHTAVAAFWEFVAGFTLYLGWNPPGNLFNDVAILVVAFGFGYGGLEGQKQAEKTVRWIFGILQDPGT